MGRDVPKVRFATVDDLLIAYQVVGDGPIDLLFHPGWPSHLELQWEHPAVARFYRRLASFSRLLLFDRRGMGLSDRGPAFQGIGRTANDMLGVMDAVGRARRVGGVPRPIRVSCEIDPPPRRDPPFQWETRLPRGCPREPERRFRE